MVAAASEWCAMGVLNKPIKTKAKLEESLDQIKQFVDRTALAAVGGPQRRHRAQRRARQVPPPDSHEKVEWSQSSAT